MSAEKGRHMRRRSLWDIEVDLAKKLRIWKGSRSTLLIANALREARDNGIRLAASVAADYDKYNSHPYLVSDCILGKLNVLKGKPRKNPTAGKIDMALTKLERRVASVEVRERRDVALTMLFDAGRSFDERVMTEQFTN